MIRTWHVCISGFLQNEGLPVGMVRLWNDLHHEYAAPDTCVTLREWRADWNALAELIWRMQLEADRPRIAIYGYSWGGMSAVLLARRLQARGIRVNQMVLSDPVYRHRYFLGNWRAFWPGSKIVVPANVDRVDWFWQHADWPRAHRLVAEDSRTHIATAWEAVGVKHEYMDDLEPFHERCRQVARTLTRGGCYEKGSGIGD